MMRHLVVLLPLLAACNPLQKVEKSFAEGIASYAASQWADAEKSFDQALATEPSAEGHFDRGMARYRQGKFDEAAEDLRRALTSADDALKARTWLDVGNTAAKQGKLEDAIQAYRRSLELDPKDPDALYNLEWALKQDKKQQENKGGNPDDQEKDGGEDDQKNEGDGKGDDGGDQAKNDASKGGDKGSDGEEGDPQPDGEQGEGQDEQQAGNEEKPGQQQGEEQGEKGEEKPDDSAQAQGQQEEQGEGDPSQQAGAGGGDEQAQAAQVKPLNAQEMEEVLDSLQASEKNLQMWKFQQRRDDPRRSPGGKDW